jgi:hypothetical protein
VAMICCLEQSLAQKVQRLKDVGKKSLCGSALPPFSLVILLEFNALLGPDAGAERMLNLFHLSDKIGGRY